MNTLVLAVALFLLAGLVVALIAAARGPTPADRMLMALLIGTTGTGMNSGGDSYIANLDANGATVSVIPDCVNRKGEPPKFLPDRPYTLCALVEFSDGSAPASAAFKLRVTYLPRRRGL